MNKRLFLKNTSLVIALVVVVYLVANYTGLVKNQILQRLNVPGASVKGASTERAQEISEKLGSDIAAQFGILEEQIFGIRIENAAGGLSRLQKIPRDIHSLQEYVKEQADNVLKSRK